MPSETAIEGEIGEMIAVQDRSIARRNRRRKARPARDRDRPGQGGERRPASEAQIPETMDVARRTGVLVMVRCENEDAIRHLLGLPDARIEQLFEEHDRLTSAHLIPLQVGDLVEIIPDHACVVVDMVDTVHVGQPNGGDRILPGHGPRGGDATRRGPRDEVGPETAEKPDLAMRSD